MRAAEEVTFGDSSLDRAAHLRAQSVSLAAGKDAATLVLWRGKALISGPEEAASLVRVPFDHAILKETGLGQIFLGMDGDAPIFATDISDWTPTDLDQDAMALFLDASENQHPALPSDHRFIDLRRLLVGMSPMDANMGATARGMFAWHGSHGFCASCGTRSEIQDAGWQRRCPACQTSHFPRTDPVVIVLAVHGNSVLLGRSPHWPEGMYSLLAGFVEPGETIEAASRREVFEESGIRLGEVTYLSSQPWPFPNSLMFGTMAQAENADITLDETELADAKWVSREDLVDALAGNDPTLKPARKGSIARFLVERWLTDDLS